MDFFGYFTSGSKDAKKSSSKKDISSKSGRGDKKKGDSQCGG
jgi:hypothetical protein